MIYSQKKRVNLHEIATDSILEYKYFLRETFKYPVVSLREM